MASRKSTTGNVPPFGEAAAWQAVGQGWRQIFGSFQNLGFSFEWHDFWLNEGLDWSRSFHPGGIEICLNLAGHGAVTDGNTKAEFTPLTAGFYRSGVPALAATRQAKEQHQFITVEFAPEFLHQHLALEKNGLHPVVREVVDGLGNDSRVAPAQRLTNAQREMIMRLRRPPVSASAQALWYQVRALDLVVEFLFQPPEGQEFFCTRQQRILRERMEKVMAILRENLVEPPSLEELARRVNSSPFYLSRMFKQEAGMTITQFLRQARMERAAELLRTGRCNVTEAAMAVGYSSLGHFSTTFQQTFGCCPGLYPLATPTQKSLKHHDDEKKVAGIEN
ncbi:MAG TPA: AraC family transcriptional regulator [Pseudomonadales bacterium]|nr:AraC family transcriptional regulator [Pseudomonadales bacterium]